MNPRFAAEIADEAAGILALGFESFRRAAPRGVHFRWSLDTAPDGLRWTAEGIPLSAPFEPPSAHEALEHEMARRELEERIAGAAESILPSATAFSLDGLEIGLGDGGRGWLRHSLNPLNGMSLDSPDGIEGSLRNAFRALLAAKAGFHACGNPEIRAGSASRLIWHPLRDGRLADWVVLATGNVGAAARAELAARCAVMCALCGQSEIPGSFEIEEPQEFALEASRMLSEISRACGAHVG